MTTLTAPDDRLQTAGGLTQWKATIHWGSTVISVPSKDFIEQPRFSTSAGMKWRNGVVVFARGEAVLAITEKSTAASSFIEAATRESWRSASLTLYLSVQNDDVAVFAGQVTEWRCGGGVLSFQVKRGFPWDERQNLCRNLATLKEGIVAGITESAWLPQVFGENRGVPAPPLFQSDSLKTAGELTESGTVVELPIPPDWSGSGRVQIGDEVIQYGELQLSPPALIHLQRDDPKWHARGARIHLLPSDGPLHWVAADHVTEVLAVRALEPDGSIESEVDTVSETLAGRSVTLIERNSLPVGVEYEARQELWNGPFGSANWDIDPLTNAVFAFAAFQNEAIPALLSNNTSCVAARWVNNLSKGRQRHDRIDRLSLAFRIRGRLGWGTNTVLRATVTRGGTTFVRDITRQDILLQDAAFTGSTSVPKKFIQSTPADSSAFHVLSFDEAEDIDGAWAGTANAISGNFSAHATRTEPLVPVALPLRVRLHRDKTGGRLTVRRVGFFARVRTSVSATVRLRFFIPGKINREYTAVCDSAWRTVGEIVDTPGLLSEDLLDEQTRFEIELLDSGIIDVAETWLNVLPEAFDGELPKASTNVLPVSGQVKLSSLPAGFELDCTELAQSESGWDVLNGSFPDLTVRFEVFGLNDSNTIELSGVHWVATVTPARRVETTDRLFTDQRGRLTEEDGLCNPVSVVSALLMDSDFAGLDASLVDGSSLATLIAAFGNDPRRFRASFAEGITLNHVLPDALGEAFLSFSPRGNIWRIADAGGIDLTPALVVDESQALEYPGDLEAFPAPLREQALVFERWKTGELAASESRFEGDGEARWRVRWLAAGFQHVAGTVFERFGRGMEEITLPLRTGWIGLEPGTCTALSINTCNLVDRTAFLVDIGYRAGSVQARFRLRSKSRVCWSDGEASLRLRPLPASWELSINGNVVARKSIGDGFAIAGHVVESALVAPLTNGPFWDVAAWRVVFTTKDESAAFAIDMNGNLLMPGRVVEHAGISAAIPACAWESDEKTLWLGTPELGAFGLFNGTTGDLSLTTKVIENQTF